MGDFADRIRVVGTAAVAGYDPWAAGDTACAICGTDITPTDRAVYCSHHLYEGVVYCCACAVKRLREEIQQAERVIQQIEQIEQKEKTNVVRSVPHDDD